MKNKIFVLLILCTLLLAPTRGVSAGLIPSPIVPPCNTGPLETVKGPDDQPLKKIGVDGKPILDKKQKEILTGEKNYAEPCDFNHVILLINNVIQFLLFGIATPLAALAITYAGFLLLFSGGSSEAKTKAKNIIKNIVIGYIVALGAWLIVNTIFKTFGFKGETYMQSVL